MRFVDILLILLGSYRAVFAQVKEVKKLLKVSDGTLQNLRIKGQLHPSKIRGLLFYNQKEIEMLLLGK